MREALALVGNGPDDGADALSVAVHLENALCVLIPDVLLSPEHLCDEAAIRRTLVAIGVA
ncbi:hypothetical protein [Microbacterium sp. 18062]|uniref:hypothetical protein n=1 Tax=Microbacterium sp. 18062 TaxID=2681410 RepID=UPI00135B452B|nr:hypothetical protein [Microbacterium sp. 18062]